MNPAPAEAAKNIKNAAVEMHSYSDKKVGNLSGTVYYLFKDNEVFECIYPRKWVLQLDGRDCESLFFQVRNLSKQSYESIEVSFSGTLAAMLFYEMEQDKLVPDEIPIIAGRAMYDLIGTTSKTVFLHSNNYKNYLYENRTNKDKIRENILSYIQERYDELHSKPFLVYEIISTLAYKCEDVLYQIKYFIQENTLRYIGRLDELYKYNNDEFIRFDVFKGEKFDNSFESIIKTTSIKHSNLNKLFMAYSELDFSRCEKTYQSALDVVEDNPDSALGRACSYLESVMKHILNYLGQSYPKKLNVNNLITECTKHLHLSEDSKSSEELRLINKSISNVSQRIGTLRSYFSEFHGKGPDEPELDIRHARYLINLSRAISLFLIETFIEQYKHKSS